MPLATSPDLAGGPAEARPAELAKLARTSWPHPLALANPVERASFGFGAQKPKKRDPLPSRVEHELELAHLLLNFGPAGPLEPGKWQVASGI